MSTERTAPVVKCTAYPVTRTEATGMMIRLQGVQGWRPMEQWDAVLYSAAKHCGFCCLSSRLDAKVPQSFGREEHPTVEMSGDMDMA